MALRATEKMNVGVPRFLHEGQVDSLSFSPDGKKLAACDVRWTTVWSLEGERLWTAAPGGRAEFLDGQLLVSGGTNEPYVFDAATGQIATTLGSSSSHTITVPVGEDDMRVIMHASLEGDAIAGLAVLSPQGETLASEGTLKAHDANDFGSFASAFLAGSPDGTRVAAAEMFPKESRIRLLDSATLKEAWRVRGLARSLVFSPDGTRVYAVLGTGALLVLDAADGREHARLSFEGKVRAVAFSADGARFAVGLGTGGVAFADPSTGAILSTFVPKGLEAGEEVTALAFSPDGTWLAAGLPQRVTLLEIATGREVGGAPAHARGVHALAILGAASTVVSRGASRTRVWTLGSGELVRTEPAEGENWPAPPVAALPGSVLLDVAGDGTPRLRNVRDWGIAGSLPTPPEGPRRLTTLATARNVRRFVAAALPPEDAGDDAEACLRIFDLDGGAVVDLAPGAVDPDAKLALSPDGALVAIALRDRETYGMNLCVLDVATRRTIATIPVESSVSGLAFLDAGTLLFATIPGALFTARVSDGQVAEAADLSIDAMALSPDGALVAISNSSSGTIDVAEAGKWNEAIPVARQAGARTLAFSDDSRYLGAGLDDGSLRVWEITR